MSTINELQLPLRLTFSFWLGLTIDIKDSQNNRVAFVKQKMWDFKEKTSLYTNSDKTELLYEIKADRIIDWSANYHISQNGSGQGYIRRKGWKSLWKATYEVFNEQNQHKYTIKEKNGFIKVLDAIFNEIPVLGLFSGFVFNPEYQIHGADNNLLYSVKKIPSFLSREFELTSKSAKSDQESALILCSVIQMLCLERRRG